MVMAVCRQIVRHPHDADDAFQATFLVLVRKARSIRVGASLAPWLYGVAYRTASRVRAAASRYRSAAALKLEEPMEFSSDHACEFDLLPVLHEELNRLPGKYREPIVLCHLEGKSHEEAARLLLPSDPTNAAAPAKIAAAESSRQTKAPAPNPETAELGMVMKFPLSLMKNAPNIAPKNVLPSLRTGSMVLVESPSRTAFEAMSLEIEHPAWRKIELPPGTTAQPYAGTDIAALMIRGKTIDHVAAFSPYTGSWSTQHLLKPIEGEINPAIGPGCAALPGWQ